MADLSLQLYSLRDRLAEDRDGTLDRVRDLGITRVEAFGFVDDPEPLAAALAERGLAVPSAHAPLGPDVLDASLSAAQTLGTPLVIEPMLEAERFTTREGVAAVAALLNDASRRAADRGLRVGYHNHAHELVDVEGATALDVLADHLDDAVVLEVDAFWAAYAGADVPALLRRLGERVVALHVKDGPLSSTDIVQVPAGTGAVDLAGALDAVPGLELAIVEYDVIPDGLDAIDAVGASADFLRARGIA